jgi:D-alanyl-lipoteichoic acid acyltransferase DltB (MBOAT superfamily)
MITFLVSGLWHGSNWTFILWGSIHGIAQCIEKYFHWNISVKGVWRTLWSVFVTFMVVNFAWIFFRMQTVGDACSFIERILSCASGDFVSAGIPDMILMTLGISVVLFKEICQECGIKRLPFVQSHFIAVRWISYWGLIFSILLFGVLDSSQFIYVNF